LVDISGRKKRRLSRIVDNDRTHEDRNHRSRILERIVAAGLHSIVSKFDIRDRNASQLAEYDDAFLDWIFYWYLATVNLTEHLLATQSR
jgi:predicted ATP-grasp superfamily ATP-dependent carboligase